jgi:hypothetical protein
MTPYDLKELLDLVCQQKAVALYLIDGFAPAIANSGETFDNLKYDLPRDTLPTALLATVEGPPLTVENLRLFVEEIKSNAGFIDSSEGAAYRFRRDSHDFDVFLFAKGDRIFIEFRQPNRWYEKRRA